MKVSNEIIKRIKESIDNADWHFETTMANKTQNYDSEKAISYLMAQKFSIKYLKNYFLNICDLDIVQELINNGLTVEKALIKEMADRIGQDRCSRFAWSGKLYSHGWDLSRTTFIISTLG